MSVLVVAKADANFGDPFVRVEPDAAAALAFVNGTAEHPKTQLWDSVVPDGDGKAVPFDLYDESGDELGTELVAPYQVAYRGERKKASHQELAARVSYQLGGIRTALLYDPKREELRDLASAIALPDARLELPRFLHELERLIKDIEKKVQKDRPRRDGDRDAERWCSPFCSIGWCCD